MMQNWPNFRMDIWFQIICQIFVKLFAINVNGGSDQYEIWCVEQLSCAEKKAQISFFVRPAVHGANIFQIFVTITFIKRIFGEVFSSHVQMVHNIYVISCLFSDWTATGPSEKFADLFMGLQSTRTQICESK